MVIFNHKDRYKVWIKNHKRVNARFHQINYNKYNNFLNKKLQKFNKILMIKIKIRFYNFSLIIQIIFSINLLNVYVLSVIVVYASVNMN